jgi:hypothetical protein
MTNAALRGRRIPDRAGRRRLQQMIEYTSAEYKRRMEERRAAGLLIDPSTAEIDWTYAQIFDPYGDGLPLLPEEVQGGRAYFARAPGSDIWVCFYDLPDATRDAIWKRLEEAA